MVVCKFAFGLKLMRSSLDSFCLVD